MPLMSNVRHPNRLIKSEQVKPPKKNTMRFRDKLKSWYTKLSAKAMKHELSDKLMGHLLSEWFGREAVLAEAVDPKIGQRVDRALAACTPVNLEVRIQLIPCGMLHPEDWEQHRDLIFGFVYGRAQRWCQESGEESDWAAIFLTMQVLLTLLENSWNEAEVTAAFDRYFETSNELFETGRTEALQLPIGGDVGGPPRVPLLKHLNADPSSKHM
jgi:hypothetical protein